TGFLLQLLSFIAVFAIAHPGSRVVSDLDYAFTADSGLSLGIRIFAIVLTVIAILNLVITLFRMRAKRGYIFDTARFGLQLIVAVVVVALSIAIPETGTAPDFGVLATLPVLLLLLVSLAEFLLALLVMILAIKRGSARSSENKVRIAQQPVQPPMMMNPMPVAPMMAPQEEEEQTTNVSIVLDRPSKPQDEEEEEEDVDEPADENKKDEPFTVSETLLPEASKPESEKVVKSIVYVTNIGNNDGEPAFDEKNDLPYDINETPIAYSDESLFDAPKKSAPVIVEIPEPKPMKEPEPYRSNEDDYEPVRDLPKTERIREIYYYKDDKEEKDEEPIEKKPEKKKEPEVKEEKPEEKKPEPVKTEFMKEMEALARDASKSAKQEEPKKPAYENRYAPPP
ncbi:MAG: hypothetical protein K2L87_00970, partial [Clostridiales bacterium]|nr:hypothetical protein [Clostridiales bacterium]